MEQIFKANDFGACADGKTVCTGSIQAAIDAAAKEGGRVVFEKGVYLTGSLFVKSGVDFVIGEGVEIRGAVDENAYPEFLNRVAGVEMVWPGGLINVVLQHNVHISGGGMINGQGDYWWNKYWGTDRHGGMRKIYDAKGLRWAVDYDCKRPRNILIFKSSGVRVENLSVKRSGFWNVHIGYSNDVTVSGLDISENCGPSTDGVDIDSSKDIVVEKCKIDCNDDNICIKSGRDGDGIRVNRPCENVTVRDCETLHGDGVTLGSETSGGMRNIEISNIREIGTKNGIRFKSARTRGGECRDIRISKIRMKGVRNIFKFDLNWNPAYSYCKLPDGYKGEVPQRWKALTAPILPESRGIPEFHDIQISDVEADCLESTDGGDFNSQIFSVNAYERKPIRNISFSNIRADALHAGSIALARDWSFRDCVFRAKDERLEISGCTHVTVPEVAKI